MLLWTMSLMFVVAVVAVMWAETRGNPHLLALGADSALNMEGKETRFGILNSSLFAVITTAASCGAVNAMHDSFTALGGMVPMWLMQLGAGMYGMLLFVVLAVFIARLMIGRTPEYLGKKVDVREMKMTALAILVTPALVLLGTALAMMTDAGQAWRIGASTALAKCSMRSRPPPITTVAPLRASAQHAVLKPAAGVLHAGWQLRYHHSGDGAGGQHGGEKGAASRQWHAADPGPAVYCAADRHGAAGGRTDLYSCSGAGSGRGAFATSSGYALMSRQ